MTSSSTGAPPPLSALTPLFHPSTNRPNRMDLNLNFALYLFVWLIFFCSRFFSFSIALQCYMKNVQNRKCSDLICYVTCPGGVKLDMIILNHS